MSSILLSGPAVEPLSLDDAKAFLKVETSDDDDVIAALIAGARIHVEAQTRRALVTQSWRLIRDAWPADGVPILPAPLRSVSAVRVYRFDGSTQTIDSGSYDSDLSAAPAVLWFKTPPPAPGRVVAGIEIDIIAGYGDTAADVPADLRQAIRLLVAHWYENRGMIAAGQTVGLLPASVNATLAPYRVLSL